jgi:hypothetical protein
MTMAGLFGERIGCSPSRLDSGASAGAHWP